MTTNAPDSITMYKRHTVKELSRAVELRASPTTNHEPWASHGPVSWTACASAESLPPTGPDFKVY